ncbi:MAG: type I-E CRISPR-associated protein Cas6/Cse3/CasE [Candidatus Methanomethylophilaceae archaeon]|nr:type I-E CRISPR-associated protein Cas6/Cse3/CasE [Candidatus Methanomethylophilaceae archaeon]
METRRALMSPQVMHAAVMSSFPCLGQDVSERVLWRVDSIGPSTYVLVQSPVKPDFSHIVDQFGWPLSEQKWDSIEYDGFLGKISNGQVLRFRLVANPVRKITEDGRKMVAAHVTVAQQKAWLIGRSERNGFVIPEREGELAFDIVSRDLVEFKRENKKVTIQ